MDTIKSYSPGCRCRTDVSFIVSPKAEISAIRKSYRLHCSNYCDKHVGNAKSIKQGFFNWHWKHVRSNFMFNCRSVNIVRKTNHHSSNALHCFHSYICIFSQEKLFVQIKFYMNKNLVFSKYCHIFVKISWRELN